MKNNQRFEKLHIIILVILIFGVILISILLGSRQKNEGVFIFYDYSNMLSENENNMGIIDRKNNKVVIFDNLGNEVSYLDTKEGCPNQIALGQDSYFLLYLWYNERDEGKIVQYDYQSNKMKECIVPNLATIASREGYLFVGNWKKREREDGLYPYFYPYFYPFYNGFYANSYIAENEFGSEFEKLFPNKTEICMVGDVELYYHIEGYFSTEPAWGDYPGTSMGDFTVKDRVYGFQTETKQEAKNRSLVLKEFAGNENMKDAIYSVHEYQNGNNIYGVCNIFEKRIYSQPIKGQDVISSFSYKISDKEGKVVIMHQEKSGIGIMTSENVYIYQKDNCIMQRNLKSGNTKVIYNFQNLSGQEIYVQGDYLLVVDDGKTVPVKWNLKNNIDS